MVGVVTKEYYEAWQKPVRSLRSPLSGWLGGKFYLSNKIIPLIPRHVCYVEPFAGAGWIYFRKPRSPVEVLNDLNKEIANTYRVIKHSIDYLEWEASWSIHSRAIFTDYQRMTQEELDLLSNEERAWRFLYLLKSSYGGGRGLGKLTEKASFREGIPFEKPYGPSCYVCENYECADSPKGCCYEQRLCGQCNGAAPHGAGKSEAAPHGAGNLADISTQTQGKIEESLGYFCGRKTAGGGNRVQYSPFKNMLSDAKPMSIESMEPQGNEIKGDAKFATWAKPAYSAKPRHYKCKNILQGAKEACECQNKNPQNPPVDDLLHVEQDQNFHPLLSVCRRPIFVGGLLRPAHKRLEATTIECLPWASCIALYDSPDTFFYIDPPYVNCERYYGKTLFSREQFAELADVLRSIRGKFFLSINNHPLIHELFAGFHFMEVDTVYSLNNTGRPKEVTELLIANYIPEPDLINGARDK